MLKRLPVVRNLFMRNSVAYFETVNNNGGFVMSGWVRRGTMVDQGLVVDSSETGSYRSPPPVMIASSSLNHHITTIKPANDSLPLIVQAQLDNLRIDVSNADADDVAGAGVGAGGNEDAGAGGGNGEEEDEEDAEVIMQAVDGEGSSSSSDDDSDDEVGV